MRSRSCQLAMTRTDDTGLRFAIGCGWGGQVRGEEDDDQTGQRSRSRREKES